MKNRIKFSLFDGLYHVQTKKLFSKWKGPDNYLYTDEKGSLISVKGFSTYEHAEFWMLDRFPGLNFEHNLDKNENMGFEF